MDVEEQLAAIPLADSVLLKALIQSFFKTQLEPKNLPTILA